jgi:hypothetical protein
VRAYKPTGARNPPSPVSPGSAPPRRGMAASTVLVCMDVHSELLFDAARGGILAWCDTMCLQPGALPWVGVCGLFKASNAAKVQLQVRPTAQPQRLVTATVAAANAASRTDRPRPLAALPWTETTAGEA